MKESVESGAQILALTNLAIAQPLYAVLSTSPEFFVAHKAGWSDLLVLVAVLSLLPAMTLTVLVWFSGLGGSRLRSCVAGLVTSMLCAVMLLPFLNRADDSSASLALAAVLGIVLGWMLRRIQFVKSFVALLAPLTVVFPLVFLLDSDVRAFAGGVSDSAAGTAPQSRAPLVLVVLDQFPTGILLDDRQQISPQMFPNIERLARGSHWYRNHTTVAATTVTSIPAILTGRYPTAELPPTASSYPENLFALLSSSYELNLFESVTQLGPDATALRPPLRGRVGPLLRDVQILLGHLVLPVSLASDLPSLEDQVAFFGDSPNESQSFARDARARVVGAFLDQVDDRERVLHYLHLLLPHGPYQFFPSGEIYSHMPRIPGLEKVWGHWGDDPIPVTKARRRFLLQALLADRLLGQIVDRLRMTELYEKALVIVTADHGASFKVGEHTRALTPNTYRDILYVPLFIKLPGQTEGVVSDRSAQTIDILPTLAAILGAEIPWPVDGVPLLSTHEGSAEKKVFDAGNGISSLRQIPAAGDEVLELDRMMEGLLFDSERSWFRIRDPNEHWLGADVDVLRRSVPETRATARLLAESSRGRARLIHSFNLHSGWVEGYVLPGRQTSREYFELAVVVDGKVAAVTRTFAHRKAKFFFSELLPEPERRVTPERVEIVILG